MSDTPRAVAYTRASRRRTRLGGFVQVPETRYARADDSGSIYLHCDPTASHYLKVLMDSIFGPHLFLNEIVWKRTSAHSSAHRYGPVHDIILYYGRSDQHLWNNRSRPMTSTT